MLTNDRLKAKLRGLRSGFRIAQGLGACAQNASLVLLAVAAAVACARARSSSNQFQIPWPETDADGVHYHLKAISIPSFEQPEHLAGRWTQVLVSPQIVDGHLQGEAPIGRFIENRDGVRVPADFVTLQATAVLAHFEKLSEMDLELKVILPWPLQVSIESNLTDHGRAIRNNAIFDRDLKALMISPYNQDGVPIMVNAGILAHEHFHMIFQALVLDQLADQRRLHKMADKTGLSADAKDSGAIPHDHADGPPAKVDEPDVDVDATNAFFLRALNEGIADFWGWVYTGDPKFIGHSLASETERRRLDVPADQFKARGEIHRYVHAQGKILSPEQLVSNAYLLGSDYARGLWELSRTIEAETNAIDLAQAGSTREGRLILAKALIASLPVMTEEIAQSFAQHRLLSPNLLLKSLRTQLSQPHGAACEVVHRLAAVEVDSFLKDDVCDKLNPAAGAALPGPAADAALPGPAADARTEGK